MTFRSFISYRRKDSAGYATALYQSVMTRFGAESVFMDFESIKPGSRFDSVIFDSIAKCDVLFAVIGPKWLTIENDEGRRLDDAGDTVRREIATALSLKILVVPVLVEGADPPPEAELPTELEALAKTNAVRLRPESFFRDVAELIGFLAERFQVAPLPERDTAELKLVRQRDGREIEQIQGKGELDRSNLDAQLQASTRFSERASDPYAPREYERAWRSLARGETDSSVDLLRRDAEQEVGQAAEKYCLLAGLELENDPHKAVEDYRYAAELAPGNLDIWYQLGNLQHFLWDLDSAADAYSKMRELAAAREDRAREADAKRKLGNVFRSMGDLDKAEAMYREAKELNELRMHKEGLAHDYNNLGSIASGRGDLMKAEQWFKKALVLNKSFKFQEGIATNLGNLGVVYKRHGDLTRAEAEFEEAIKILEELQRGATGYDAYRLGIYLERNYGNLGNAYQDNSLFEKATAMYEKAGRLSQKLQYREGMAMHQLNLGVLHRRLGELLEAETALEMALPLFRQIGDKRNMANVVATLAGVAADRRNFDTAKEQLEEALRFFKQTGTESDVAEAYNNLGNVHGMCEEFQQAEQMFLKALGIYMELHNQKAVDEIEGSLREVAECRGHRDPPKVAH